MHNYVNEFELLIAEDPGILLPGEKSSNPIVEKSFAFSLMIVDLFKKMKDQKEFIISKQILTSGTSIGANVQESLLAQSKKDFIAKLRISVKEARECKYWLLVVHKSQIVKIDCIKEIEYCDEILKILFAILKTSSNESS